MIFAPSNHDRAKIWIIVVSKTSDHIQINIRMQTPVRNIQRPSKPHIRTQRKWIFFASLKSRQRPKIGNIDETKTSDHIQINIRMPIPSQEPPVSFKAPYQDLKDMDVLCICKIKIEPKFRIWMKQRPVTISKLEYVAFDSSIRPKYKLSLLSYTFLILILAFCSIRR